MVKDDLSNLTELSASLQDSVVRNPEAFYFICSSGNRQIAPWKSYFSITTCVRDLCVWCNCQHLPEIVRSCSSVAEPLYQITDGIEIDGDLEGHMSRSKERSAVISMRRKLKLNGLWYFPADGYLAQDSAFLSNSVYILRYYLLLSERK
jgi:hypothetical protein